MGSHSPTINQGQLVIIGGAEDKQGDCKILREFVRRAGGRQAKIVVMTVATELPKEVGDNYIQVFERLGVEQVRVVDTDSREEAEAPEALATIRESTGVFFTGGKQDRITKYIKGTKLDQLLHQLYAQGLIIAGTSAGASMMSDAMIVEGEAETHPRIEIVETDDGLSFMPEAIIDQHFAQRGRLGRLLSAVAEQPDLLGIGIDENTAIVVSGGQMTVIGEGAVTIVDLQDLIYSNLHNLLKDEGLALCGVKLHILPDGYSFDINSRSAVVEANFPKAA
ncbi:MAG: cyanophycinase [Trichocoleus desertorum ATA4-8-CV12]|nr:cyanophycinase [Trichocoleus desertorum ATA4-8-CV12]